MKYVSIDIETGGLDRDCSLLEFGAVVDDLEVNKPVEELPKFHTYILNKKVVGEPYALAMHQKILQRISKREEPYTYIWPTQLEDKFYDFLIRDGGIKVDTLAKKVTRNFGDDVYPLSIVVAGKNFAMFDNDWLKPLFGKCVRIKHRVVDPAMFYFKASDEAPPSGQTCMERAGITGEVAHTAAEDALMVVKLVRKGILNVR